MMTALAAIALIRNGRGCVSAGPSDAEVADLSTQLADWPICKFFLTAMVDEALTVATQSSVADYRLCAASFSRLHFAVGFCAAAGLSLRERQDRLWKLTSAKMMPD